MRAKQNEIRSGAPGPIIFWYACLQSVFEKFADKMSSPLYESLYGGSLVVDVPKDPTRTLPENMFTNRKIVFEAVICSCRKILARGRGWGKCLKNTNETLVVRYWNTICVLYLVNLVCMFLFCKIQSICMVFNLCVVSQNNYNCYYFLIEWTLVYIMAAVYSWWCGENSYHKATF